MPVVVQRIVGLFRGPQLLIAYRKSCAHSESGEPPLMSSVKRKRHEQQFARSGRHAVDLSRSLAVHGKGSVRDGDTFRQPRGSRGV